MSKEIYLNISGQAKKVSKIYVNSNNQALEISIRFITLAQPPMA